MLRAAALTLGALTGVTSILMAVDPPTRAGSPGASGPAARPGLQVHTGPDRAIDVAHGLTSNSHAGPRTTTGALPTIAPPLRPELQAAYSLAVSSAPSGCRVPLSLLAAIGQVESGNLAEHGIDDDHRAVPAILGPVLDGRDRPAVPDTDAGQLDQDPAWDRAVGPMQLVPAVWRAARVDMDSDGDRDPQNVYDAAGAAMVYLCAEGRDLSTAGGVRDAVLSYERSRRYLALVLAWKTAFDLRDQMLYRGTIFSAFAATGLLPANFPVSGPVQGRGPSAGTPSVPTTPRPVGPSALPGASPGPGVAGAADPSGPGPSSGPSPGPSSGPPTGPPIEPTPEPTAEPTEAPPTAGSPPNPTPGPPDPGPSPLPTAPASPPADPQSTPEPVPTCASPTPADSPPVDPSSVDPGASPASVVPPCSPDSLPATEAPAP